MSEESFRNTSPEFEVLSSEAADSYSYKPEEMLISSGSNVVLSNNQFSMLLSRISKLESAVCNLTTTFETCVIVPSTKPTETALAQKDIPSTSANYNVENSGTETVSSEERQMIRDRVEAEERQKMEERLEREERELRRTMQVRADFDHRRDSRNQEYRNQEYRDQDHYNRDDRNQDHNVDRYRRPQSPPYHHSARKNGPMPHPRNDHQGRRYDDNESREQCASNRPYHGRSESFRHRPHSPENRCRVQEEKKTVRVICAPNYVNTHVHYPCVYCGNQHSSDQCPEFVDPKDRRHVLSNKGKCSFCLGNHPAFKCQRDYPNCCYCLNETDDYHHHSLCPVPRTEYYNNYK